MKTYFNFNENIFFNTLKKDNIIYYDDMISDYNNLIQKYGIQKFNFKTQDKYTVDTENQHTGSDHIFFSIKNDVTQLSLSWLWNGSNYPENDLEDHLLIMPFFLFNTTNNKQVSLTPFAIRFDFNEIIIFSPEWQDYISTSNGGWDNILPFNNIDDVIKLYNIIIKDTKKSNRFYDLVKNCFIPELCKKCNIYYDPKDYKDCLKMKASKKFNL